MPGNRGICLTLLAYRVAAPYDGRMGTMMTTSIGDYEHRYENAAIERHEGVLEVRLHTDGGPFVWSRTAHDQLPYLFEQISADRDNAVVILTGTGDSFCASQDISGFGSDGPEDWDEIFFEGRRLMNSLLGISVPVVSAVNGPAHYHAELSVMSDIVLATPEASFRDSHYQRGVVPGDGTQVVWCYVLGPSRGRHFLLTGAELDAPEAHRLGVVGEVVPADRLMSRAREIAADLAAKPFLTRRYTREVLTHELKLKMLSGIGIGLSMQGLAKTNLTFPRNV
jgi:enoyl-CoA hydratase/carnithine racemase